MPRVPVTLAESAVRDLQDVARWYADRGVPDAGSRLVGEIVRRIEALGTNPDMGRVVPEFERTFLRELIHPPFRIVYRRDPAEVRIVRVWRSERRLELPGDESR